MLPIVNSYEPPAANVAVEPAPEPGAAVLASRWKRLWGGRIDALIGMVLFVPLSFWTGYWSRVQSDSVGHGELLVWSLVGLVFFVIVHGYTLLTRGQTTGKLLVGTAIVAKDAQEIRPLGWVALRR